MSEIKKGDLVMVIRGHSCVMSRFGGLPMRVAAAHGANYPFSCSYCGNAFIALPQDWVEVESSLKNVPLSYVVKIDPPATGDEVSTRVPRKQDARETV